MGDAPHYARIAYNAYSWETGGKSLATGDSLPSWDDLPRLMQEAWHTAAMAVVHEVEDL